MPNRKRVLIFIACGLTLFSLFTVIDHIDNVSADEADDWPMFRLNYEHTGFKEGIAPDTNETNWIFNTTTNSRWIVSSPMIVDGYVYIGSENGKLYKLDLDDGTEIWNYTADENGGRYKFWSSPFVDLENNMVLCHADGVHAVNLTTGERIWRFDSGIREFSAPVVHNDVVFVGSFDNCIYALPQTDPNGDGNITNDEIVWVYYSGEYQNGVRIEDTGGAVSTTLAIVDGMVFGAEQTQMDSGSSYCDYNAFCLPEVDPDGSGEIEHVEIIWKYEIGEHLPLVDTGVPGEGGDCFSSPSVNVDEGHVYIGSRDMFVYCLAIEPQGDGLDNDGDGLFDNEGELIWRSQVDNEVYSSPSVHDGNVFIGSGRYALAGSPGTVYCFRESDGGEIWNYPHDDGFLSSPLVADGKVFIGSNDDILFAFNESDGAVVWRYLAETPASYNAFGSSPSLYKDQIVIGNCNGRVYNFHTPRINYPPEVVNRAPFDGSIVTSDVILEWDGSDPNPGDDVEYTVLLHVSRTKITNEDGDVYVSGWITSESFSPVDLEEGEIYYWRIYAHDGESGSASDIWSFSVNSPPAVNLLSPESGETVLSDEVVLYWDGMDADDDQLNYTVYFGTNSTDPALIENSYSETDLTVDGLADKTTYYWRVKATDGMEEHTSPIWNFTVRIEEIENSAPTIILETPEDGVIFTITEVMLGWTGEDDDGDDLSYTVYMDTSSDPDTIVIQDHDTVYVDVVNLTDGETYYWKVEVSDGRDKTESDVWSFSIDIDFIYNAPPTIELTFPLHELILYDDTLTLMWKGKDDDKDSLTYDVYLGIGPDSTVLVSEDQPNKNYPTFGLLRNQTYFWYVVVKDGTTEVSSETRSFHVQALEEKDDDEKEWYEEITDEPLYLGVLAVVVVLVIIILIGASRGGRGNDEFDWGYDEDDDYGEWD